MLGKIDTGGEGDDRGWAGWMASSTQWTWVWVNSRSWWWTGKPGVLQSMGLQRVGHDWVIDLKQKTSHSMPRLPTCRNNDVIYNIDELINISCISAVPNCFGIRDQFCGRQFFCNRGGGGWEDGMVSGWFKCIYHALYFYYYYIVIYNEIIIQLTTVQNQWKLWACFLSPRWSHLGVMGDRDTWRALLLSWLLHNVFLVTVMLQPEACTSSSMTATPPVFTTGLYSGSFHSFVSTFVSNN